jgi:hypothetical protein
MKSSRRGGVLGSVVIAGVAYVLGARAGRARYDQIMEKAKSLKNQAQERLGERPEGDSWEGRASTSSTASAGVPAPLGTVHADELATSEGDLTARPDSEI